MDFTVEDLVSGMIELVETQRHLPCYLRPIILRGYGEVGVNPFNSPTEVYICQLRVGQVSRLGDDEGVDVCVSSWNRLAPNTMPAMAKAGANYMNSQLIKMEAIMNGYVEGIALDVNGYVSEGSGENVFLVRQGTIYTAPLGDSVLPGITRDSVMKIAKDLGIPVIEQMIPREMLYIADEVFFSGTAAEITPIRSVDKISVNKGVSRSDRQGAAKRVLRHRARRNARSPQLVHSRTGEREAAGRSVGLGRSPPRLCPFLTTIFICEPRHPARFFCYHSPPQPVWSPSRRIPHDHRYASCPNHRICFRISRSARTPTGTRDEDHQASAGCHSRCEARLSPR